jgi:hypothetical protein
MGLGMMLSDVSSALNAAFLEGYLALPLLTVQRDLFGLDRHECAPPQAIPQSD